MNRVLLGHLASNGDCLYATTIARQIKHDYPGCHLTWAVGTLSKSVLANNPDIDAIWEIPMRDWNEMESAWAMFEREASRLHAAGVFDRVFLTQISPYQFANYDGTIRPSVLRNYGRPITVEVENTIRLTAAEIARVNEWYAASPAAEAPYAILFECSSKSGQSFMSVPLAIQVAEAVTAARPGVHVLISTHEKVETDNPRIRSAGALSLRETARLTHYMDLFVGCGSGLTVIATSSASKRNLPNIQVLNRSTSVYASFRHDFEYFGKPASHFMEVTDENPHYLIDAILAVIDNGFPAARERFDQPVPLTFDWYIQLIDLMLVQRGLYADAANSLRICAERYGPNIQLLDYARRRVSPFIEADRRASFPQRRASLEAYCALYGASRERAGLARLTS